MKVDFVILPSYDRQGEWQLTYSVKVLDMSKAHLDHYLDVMFQLRVTQSVGDEFENLFGTLMEESDKDFNKVEAYGKIGDKHNDGYNNNTHTYYQCYGPKSIKGNEDYVKSKIKNDFKGVCEEWKDIKEWYFVYNDKFCGAPPHIIQEIQDLNSSQDLVNVGLFLTKKWRDIFSKLTIDQKQSVLGWMAPNPDDLLEIEDSAFNSVIAHVMNIDAAYTMEKIPASINVARKINFNGLSDHVGHLLQTGLFLQNEIRKHFEYEYDQKEIIRSKLSNIYFRLKSELGSSENPADKIFFTMLKELSPTQTTSIQHAVIALIAYYFEVCDIYETPPSTQQQTLF